jgi:hypothetical protein
MKAETGGRHRSPLLAPLRGAIVIPLLSRWYRPLSRTQPPANGFDPSGVYPRWDPSGVYLCRHPSGFASDRCSNKICTQNHYHTYSA